MPTQHAKLSPSAAYRWFECQGSVSAQAGLPDSSNEYAREGTAAHELAELSLKTGLSPSKYLGRKIEVPYTDKDGPQVQVFTVDQDMADHVAVYTDYVRQVGSAMGARVMIEERVGLAAIAEELNGVWGTADAVVYDPNTKTLHVIDLKYGRGKAVAAEGNLQLRIYGLATWATLGTRFAVERIHVTIVQPRTGELAVKTAEYTAADLIDFSQDVIDAVWRVENEPDVRHAGPWCDFCKVADCLARANAAMAVAQEEFALAPVQSLTKEQAVELLDKAELLEDWIKGVRAWLHSEAMSGNDVPGYKLVPKRATRVYTAKPEEIVAKLRDKVATEAQLYEKPDLLSPAQMEKVVGKKAFKEADLTVSVSSGYSLVRDTDSRPGISFNPADDFI